MLVEARPDGQVVDRTSAGTAVIGTGSAFEQHALSVFRAVDLSTLTKHQALMMAAE